MPKIKFQDIENAFYYANVDPSLLNEAWVNKKTGEILYETELEDIDEEFPAALDSEDFIEIPHKYDLELGTRLVFDFVAQFIPEKYDDVHYIFSKKGAYRRFKNFLTSLYLLDKWYQFEEQKTKEALLEWCKDNGLDVEVE